MTDETKPAPWAGPVGPSSWGRSDGGSLPWEYAPAPESRDVVQLQARYGLFVDRSEEHTLNSSHT